MRRIVLGSILFLVLAPAVALADGNLDELRDDLNGGRYRATSEALDKLLKERPDDPGALLLRGRLRLETGLYPTAGTDLRKVVAAGGETAADAADLLVEVLLRMGRADEALEFVDAQIAKRPKAVRPILLRGRVLRLRGRRADARDAFRSLLKHFNENPVTDPRDRFDVAVATIHLAELAVDTEVKLSPTMKLLDRLTRDDPDFVDAFIVKGDLLVKWQKDVDARKEYRKALKVNPRHPEALRGMAESYAFRMNFGQAHKQAALALKTNPNLALILCYQAGVKIADYEFATAKKTLDAVLALNPNSTEARTLLGAAAFVTGDLAEFEKQAAKVLAFDPTCGDYHHTLAEVLESHRRFEEAATWARKALEIDPRNWAAAFTLGRNLLNVGKDEEAFQTLDRAERLDPYPHVWRHNYLELFDAALSKFIGTKTDHFVLRIHAKESRVLQDLMGQLMERAYEVLGDKYGHQVRPPVLVEVFHVHADFAARTVGMPGLGALGACFGRVITLDSPSARKPGEFAWAATAWHEFAHSVTLGLSKCRVPRWFTEGLSVYEERCLAPCYQRRMERELYDAYHNGKLPKIARFNAEFRGPRVLFAYFLGGMMCEYITEKHGFVKIPEMLRLYGENKQDAAVFKQVLGVSLDEFDAGFRGWVEKFIGDYKLRPRWDGDAVKRFRAATLGGKGADDFDSHISLAEAFVQRGNFVDGGIALSKAMKIRPQDPRVLIVKGHMAAKNRVPKKAREFFEQALAMPGGEDFDARLALAHILKNAGDHEAAMASFEIAKKDFPFYVAGGNPYAELAAIHEALGNRDAALAEKRALVDLVETEIDVRLELAAWAEEKGDLEQAARDLREVVLIYPLNAETNSNLARVLRKLKRWDDAALAYRMAIELKPKSGLADHHAELAEVEFMRGRLTEAKIEALHALEIEPEHAGAKAVLEKLD
jgi:tetratricopeptide (TPR) repeat protein